MDMALLKLIQAAYNEYKNCERDTNSVAKLILLISKFSAADALVEYEVYLMKEEGMGE
ncbi:hypothetical protein [Chitinophaga sp. Ak27]|uniref:hypothetical protein n=1 Tax=Chitinophaga sp. Ak27 TaxID=2726116 RepID=UPI00145E7D7B|nr:hypothetical protein [Chitinophaga sp. Ak27]NLU92389.1 hypothetical protein [Chitinophaga sp. Ak27]